MEWLSLTLQRFWLAIKDVFAEKNHTHVITKNDVGLGNVENKSSATIRSEITKANVTTALGYTPPTTDTVYTHPTATAYVSGLYKITTNNLGHVTAATAVTKSDITALGIPATDTNTTYGVATSNTNGLMSSADFSKLSGIAANANNYTHPTTEGYKHIPSGGANGQILKYSSNGTASWGDAPSSSVELTREEYDSLVVAGTIDENKIYNVTDDYDANTVIDDNTSSTESTYSSNKINSTFSKKSMISNATLISSSWENNDGQISYIVNLSGVTPTNNIEVTISNSCTQEQYEAWGALGLAGAIQTTGSFTMIGFGELPTIDIPILIAIRGD